jgi:hypothetical protein
VELLALMLGPDAEEDVDLAEVVQTSLVDVPPRSAALALLRLPRYLSLIRAAGLEPTDELCTALVAELRAVCARDAAAATVW